MADIKFEDLDRLALELSSMTRAGIPLPEGLRQLAESLKPGRLKSLAGDLAAASDKGVPLSRALGDSPIVIPAGFIALVQCAEVSGDLRSVMAFAVEHARRVKRHRSAVFTTLVYPVIVLVVLVATIVFLSRSVVPQLLETAYQMNAEFPLPTMALIYVCDLFTGDSGLCMALILGVMILSLLFVQPVQERFMGLLTHLPGFRSLIALSDTALFSHALGRMLGHGVPLPSALSAAGLAVWEKSTRAMIRKMTEAATQGHRVGPLIGGEVPSMAAYLFRQGEERGDLADACAGIAEYCEDRFDRLSKRAVAFLEPAVLLIVALLIALVLTGIYLPLFSIPRMVGSY